MPLSLHVEEWFVQETERELITEYNIAPPVAKKLVTDSWFSRLLQKAPDDVLAQSPGDSSDYGVCNITYTGSYINYFTAMVNSGNTNISTSKVARSAAVHELGHGIGLDHTTGTSIMNSARDRTKIYTPQTDDINGVNARY